jgi:hypothetical protein
MVKVHSHLDGAALLWPTLCAAADAMRIKTLTVLIVGLGALARGWYAPRRVLAQSIPGTSRVADRRAVVNLRDLARRESERPPHGPGPRVAPRPRGWNTRATSQPHAGAAPVLAAPAAAPAGPPTWPGSSFPALEDNNDSIPPDTNGAVGPDHLMVTLNTQVRIQDREGTALSTVTLNAFWASLGNPHTFDPKIAYDPFENRWIFAVVANAETRRSAVLVAVSQTSDPTGAWNLFAVAADPNRKLWADFPSLGFNKDWVAIGANMFTVRRNRFARTRLFVFDKADLYGNGRGRVTVLAGSSGSFTLCPALTYDNTLATLFLLDDFDGNHLRISTITGAVGAEALTVGTGFVISPDAWGLAPPVPNFLPQLGSPFQIDAGDARLASCVFRNGSLWTVHTVFLDAPVRAAVQWWQVDTNGTIRQRGRVDDPAGQQHFAYPSIGVNADDDVVVGYSRFSPSQFASANYSFRGAADPPGILRTDTVAKEGEAPYAKRFGKSRVRWGDYSNACVDPLNDADLWTIQEFAATPSQGLDRWGTWWARVAVAPSGPVAPRITSVLAASAVERVPFSYTVTARGTPPIAIAVDPMPPAPGLTFEGVTITGTPPAAGDFPITITASNSVGSDVKTLSLTVLADLDGDGIPDVVDDDDDGDGFPDDVELALGTDPRNRSDTPFGGAPGQHVPLNASRLSRAVLRLRFDAPGRDSIALVGRLPVPSGFDVTGAHAALDFGGIVKAFTLDRRGRSAGGTSDHFAVRVRRAGGRVPAQEAHFTARFQRGSFQAQLLDEGFRNDDVRHDRHMVRLFIVFAQSIVDGDAMLLYRAKLDAAGRAKLVPGGLPGPGPD